jgi:hypothetical protein
MVIVAGHLPDADTLLTRDLFSVTTVSGGVPVPRQLVDVVDEAE